MQRLYKSKFLIVVYLAITVGNISDNYKISFLPRSSKEYGEKTACENDTQKKPLSVIIKDTVSSCHLE